MEFRELLEVRRSVRKYKETQVSEADLAAILEAANLAPSAGNLQSYHVVVLRDAAQREAMAEAALGQVFAGTAPVALVFLADIDRASQRFQSRGELYATQDATIAATYAWLAVADLGLTGAWIGAFEDAKMAKVVDAPAGCRPVAVVTVGVPDDAGPQPKARRGLAALVREAKCDGLAYEAP
jgi:nitroreductase